MKLEISHCPDVGMARGSITVLDHSAGTRLRCVAGTVWITVDGDPDDVILQAGQSWRVPGSARVIAQAMERSTLRFETRPECAPAAARRPLGAEPAFA